MLTSNFKTLDQVIDANKDNYDPSRWLIHKVSNKPRFNTYWQEKYHRLAVYIGENGIRYFVDKYWNNDNLNVHCTQSNKFTKFD